MTAVPSRNIRFVGHSGQGSRTEHLPLRRYHERLVSQGVGEYSFADLLADYRITIPMWQATAKRPAPIRWSHLERPMRAFEDLAWAELL